MEKLANDNNHLEASPFSWNPETFEMTIDEYFWNWECTSSTRHAFEAKLAGEAKKHQHQHLIPTIRLVSHLNGSQPFLPETPSDYEWPELERYLYQLYCHQFSALHWERNQNQHPLTRYELQTLKEWSLRYLTRDTLPTAEEYESLPSFMAFVRTHLRSSGCSWFVKFSSSSGKQDRPVRPLSTWEDVVLFLIESRYLLREYELHLKYEFECSVVMKPFDSAIQPGNEYRMFVSHTQLRAVTIQHWYDERLVNQIDLDKLMAWWVGDNTIQRIYASYVMDFYIDNDNIPHFIEYNPWSSRGKFYNGHTCNWSSSGCGRFHSQLHSTELGLTSTFQSHPIAAIPIALK